MPAKKQVLSIGSDTELLLLRHAVLKSAGFDVQTVSDAKDALEKIRTGYCGVLLICYSFEVETRKELADTFRHHCPNGRIVSISDRQPDVPYFGDVLVYGLDGPEVLIEAIQGNSQPA
jgi:CheY-like chemotaxis protein